MGEDENRIRMLLGEPTQRSYETPETLYYVRRQGKATLFLERGVVVRIQFHIDNDVSESLQWYSALGLSHSMISDLSETEAKKVILELYENPEYIEKPGKLWINSRGIGFEWSSTGLSYVEIFTPWNYY